MKGKGPLMLQDGETFGDKVLGILQVNGMDALKRFQELRGRSGAKMVQVHFVFFDLAKLP